MRMANPNPSVASRCTFGWLFSPIALAMVEETPTPSPLVIFITIKLMGKMNPIAANGSAPNRPMYNVSTIANKRIAIMPNAIGIDSEMRVFPTGPCSSFTLFVSDLWLFTISFRLGAFQFNFVSRCESRPTGCQLSVAKFWSDHRLGNLWIRLGKLRHL